VSDPLACDVCGNTAGNRTHTARERMFGLGDEFTYLECEGCGLLRLLDPPKDMSRYYPDRYYSFKPKQAKRQNALHALLRRERTKRLLKPRSIAGALLVRVFGLPEHFHWFRRVGLEIDDPILDVGCGAGRLLFVLRRAGFGRLMGVDPFVAGDIEDGGVRILKRPIEEVEGTFRFVMLHHSFEHMAAPRDVLVKLRRLVEPGRFVLVRTPVTGTFAWRHYGTRWVQLDAPRHLYLHSVASLSALAATAGFAVDHVEFDSTEFQLWGSELYLRDLPLYPHPDGLSPDELERRLAEARPTEEQMTGYRRRASELNTRGDGDQACFYLRAIGSSR
jgi:SAM-dependent methyltransferase